LPYFLLLGGLLVVSGVSASFGEASAQTYTGQGPAPITGSYITALAFADAGRAEMTLDTQPRKQCLDSQLQTGPEIFQGLSICP
jgi:hypothetical protein